MILEPLSLDGAWRVLPEPLADERGWFARTWDAAEFRERGIDFTPVAANTSHSARAGVLRGLHYQAPPHGEPKLIACVRGAAFDVVVDVREGSPAYGRWHAERLDAETRAMVFVPAGFAHGFQALADGTELAYLMGAPYVPEAARGIRWDDPALGIGWPDPPPGGRILSERDRALPGLGG